MKFVKILLIIRTSYGIYNFFELMSSIIPTMVSSHHVVTMEAFHGPRLGNPARIPMFSIVIMFFTQNMLSLIFLPSTL